MKLQALCLILILMNLNCASKSTHSPVTAPVNFSRQPTSAETDKNFENLHVDLRDIAIYSKDFPGAAKVILSAIERNPALIKAPYDRGATSILSIDFEKIEVVNSKKHNFELLLFLGNNGQYFFRRLSVNIDWTRPRTPTDQRFELTQFIEDIPLGETAFVATVDIFANKLILVDEAHKIWKVFPLQVGALDIRTQDGMDGKVVSLTKELPTAKLIKVKNNQEGLNTRNRASPRYYRGLPYFSVYVDGEAYRETPGDRIAIAASPTPNGFISARGFISHGTIRLNDRDLYQLDTILNEGSQSEMDFRIVNSAPEFELLDHPMPKANEYNALVYSKVPTSQNVVCQSNNGPSKMAFQGDWHTKFDSDCAAELAKTPCSVSAIVAYAKGLSQTVPKGPVQKDGHVQLPIDPGVKCQ